MGKKWMLRLKNLVFNLTDLQIPVYAANACYFLAIAIFPALLLILASLRYTPLSAVDLIRLCVVGISCFDNGGLSFDRQFKLAADNVADLLVRMGVQCADGAFHEVDFCAEHLSGVCQYLAGDVFSGG